MHFHYGEKYQQVTRLHLTEKYNINEFKLFTCSIRNTTTNKWRVSLYTKCNKCRTQICIKWVLTKTNRGEHFRLGTFINIRHTYYSVCIRFHGSGKLELVDIKHKIYNGVPTNRHTTELICHYNTLKCNFNHKSVNAIKSHNILGCKL